MILMNLTAFTVAKFFYKVYSSGINLILNFKAFLVIIKSFSSI